ncbi:MAG: DNA repair protein RecO [Candidatus Pacebacteria bacterium]|nr:DNA repair protein RecO [Candidatus Paceibacterota bacterium]MCF7862641.1 DNA repair protein RecO [Candidatus Paceibacterota bacterium]
MHHIHHTEALILDSRNIGETGKYYVLFTKDLGMIYASAQGVRKLSSKLRFVLQDFSYIKVDLVRGKDFWRITSASKTNILDDLKNNKSALSIFVRVASLLKRLLSGEETNETLFEDLINGFLVLERNLDIKMIRDIETMIVLKILGNLGYIGGDPEYDKLIKSPIQSEFVFELATSRAKILATINKALKETHL